MQIQMECYGITDIGRKRSSNQDQFLIADLKPALAIRRASIADDEDRTIFGEECLTLLAIADGMGGQPGGERASELAVQSIGGYMLQHLPASCGEQSEDVSDIRDHLLRAVEFCRAEIANAVRQSPELRDMGTTLTAACISRQHLFVVHVGDSRCYLWRDGQLHQLTHDHTLAQRLVDGGGLTKEEAQRSPWNHVLWNALSGDVQGCRPELHHAPLHEDDKLLLCTDGLTRHVADDRIATLLSCGYGTQAACQALIHDANKAGGTDNVTVIMAAEKSLHSEAPSTVKMISST